MNLLCDSFKGAATAQLTGLKPQEANCKRWPHRRQSDFNSRLLFPTPGTCDSAAAMSGILKRKFEDVEASSPCSSARESDDEVSSSESADSGDSVNPSTSNHFTREYWNHPGSGRTLRSRKGDGNHRCVAFGHFHFYLYG